LTQGDGIDPARRDFLKRFFHDIATPLSAVSLHLEGADRRVRRGADPSGPLAVARTELGKAFDLFNQGREFLLEARHPSERVVFDDAVGEAAARHPGVRVEGRAETAVLGDPAALREAISALLTNAVEAAGAESVVVHVERAGSRVVAVFENPGALSTENPDTLFSPKAARPGRTWGMGLSRARVAAGDLGGAVRLEQKDGRVLATLDLPEEPR
jgi:two-component system OmpR family sensor kinase